MIVEDRFPCRSAGVDSRSPRKADPFQVGSIFLKNPDGSLTEMNQEPYESEALLQELLAEHPDLLAGADMTPAEPRRWLLVAREAGVPADINSGDRWSLDHLFLDQDGVPTLVEVKRSNDTRIRREVIGQMLDYAANAVAHWPMERIHQLFLETCHDREGARVPTPATPPRSAATSTPRPRRTRTAR